MLRKMRAQSTLEYALLISVIVAALIGINIFMRRGVMGRMKASADQVGEQFDANVGYNIAYRSGTQAGSQTVTTEQRNIGADGLLDADGDGFTITEVAGETVDQDEYSDFGQTGGVTAAHPAETAAP